MNFGEFEIRIDFGIDRDEIFFAAQEVEKCTEIPMHQATEYNSGALLTAAIDFTFAERSVFVVH
jgi:hypothetical protein